MKFQSVVSLVSVLFCQGLSKESFCTAERCLVSVCGLYVIKTEAIEFSELTKDMKVTLERI